MTEDMRQLQEAQAAVEATESQLTLCDPEFYQAVYLAHLAAKELYRALYRKILGRTEAEAEAAVQEFRARGVSFAKAYIQ